MRKPTTQKESGEPLVSLPNENVIADPEDLQPRTFSEIVGQADAVRRITALVNLAKRRGETLGHILLVGPEGSGKRTLAYVIARELGVNVRETSASPDSRAGDLVAIMNDLEKGDILLLRNIDRLRNAVVEEVAPALRKFELDIVVTEGRRVKDMKLAFKPFTLIGTVQKQGDCSQELFRCFDVVIPFGRYSEQEMIELTERRAAYRKLPIESGAVTLVAKLADSNPGRIDTLLHHLRLVENQPVSRQDAEEILSVFGYAGLTSAGTLGTPPSNWGALSGIEFERMMVELLNSIGFRAAMTKASGDGGVDIEATLDRPIVGGRYLFQCKRFAPDALVGSAAVREFYGALIADRKAVKGVFITTSGFTPHAREFAENLPMELIDGKQLARLIADNAGTDPSEPKSTPQP